MFFDIRFQQLNRSLLNQQPLLPPNNLLLPNLITFLIKSRHNAAILDPPILDIRIREIPDKNIDGLAIVRDENIMRHVELDQFVYDDAEDER